MELTENEIKAKERICLALDVPTVKDALKLADELKDFIGYFKIGKELHTSACNEGIPIIQTIHEMGAKVFLDLKYHDTPNTVYKDSKASTVPGVAFFNIHIAGGEDMCKKAVLGAHERAKELNISPPKIIGVTVLTSLDDEDLNEQNLGITYENLVIQRAKLAEKWGLDGIVCPANKAKEIQVKLGVDYLFVTPGIKWEGKHGTGQKQLYTPDRAVQDCKNSILVIGSAITKRQNRRNITLDIIQNMSENM